MKTAKRTLAMVLAVAMLLSCMMLTVFADETNPVKLYNAAGLVSSHASLQDALAAYDSTTQYVVLEADAEADITLNADLYIDLNGNDLGGSINLNGYDLYGMDSTTNEYSDANVGVLRAVITGGAPVEQFKEDGTRLGSICRYVAVQGEEGYTFHRIYMGITHMSLKPAATGVGYKAAFYGDATVQAQLDEAEAFGYTLWLEGYNPVSRGKSSADFASGKELSLLLKNFDVENFGETKVYASVWMKLSNGTMIESADYSYTLREMLEIVNDDFAGYSRAQKLAVRNLCTAHSISNWDIATILAYEPYMVDTTSGNVIQNDETETLSISGSEDVEVFFKASDDQAYARNWELTGTVTRENAEGMVLSFGVKDKEGKTQWFGIKEHAASLDKEGNTTIYDDVHAWWNEPACSFYWRYENFMTINYKITVVDDVLKAYFGKVGEELRHAWTFPLTDARFGGFTADSEYQLGIYVHNTCGLEMSNMEITTDNTPDSFQVASSTAGITYDKTAGTVSYDGAQNTTEIFFGAKDNDGYARNWELTGTVTRENVADMILSFGVKDKSGKTQWFSIKEHAAGLDNEGNNTIYDDVHAWWNYPACAFYYRYEDAMTINYKITVVDDVLKAYFGKVGEELQQAWSFPLTDSQFGGFAVDSEYQLGIFTRVPCGLEMTSVKTQTNNAADNFQVASNSAGISYDRTAGTVTYDGSQNTTELFFAGVGENGYARNWEISGFINKAWTEGMILSFGVKDASGKTQWFSIKEHAAGLDNEGNNTIYNDVNAWWNEPACNFYWNNSLTLAYKITVQDDVLRAYFGYDANNLQHAWTFPLTDSQFGGFGVDSEYQVGIFSRVACAMNFTDVKATSDNTPDPMYVENTVGGISADTVNGVITADGSGNTETYLKASPNAAYATDWEMTGTLKKTNSKDETLFVSFGVFDAAGREQWFTILGDSMSRQWFYNWWDTEYKPDGTYVFPNAAAKNFFDRGTDTISYKLVIEKDTLKMYFGADNSDLKLAWNLPLTNAMFGHFVTGDAYRIGIRTVDPCAFTISDVKVTAKGVESNPSKILRREEIQIRDPFILVDNDTYYLYGTQNFGSFNVYSSKDLNYWIAEGACFTGSEDFWGNAAANVEGAEAAYWAPEVYAYDGAYYMFATFTQEGTTNQQGTAVLKASSPVGPFAPWSDGPITPAGHSCLDGTLYIENGTPYLVYAHEWQCACRNYSGTGTMNYVQLSADLKTTVGDAKEWFGAGDLTSFWDELLGTNASSVTDGPKTYTDLNGQNYLLWSTKMDVDGNMVYAQLATKFSSIGAKVSLKADTVKLYTTDGGHGMIFTDLEGVETLVLHAPDSGVCRPELFNVIANNKGIVLTQRDGSAVDGSGENTADPLFHVASKSNAVLVNAYEAEIYTSNSGNSEIYFGADAYGAYARNWEISGYINKEWTEGLLLSFGVRDAHGRSQWFSIKEHAAGLDKEASTTIYDGTHAWWNEPSCNFYWNNSLNLAYKIVVRDDVLYAYFGYDANNLQHAWTFPLTDSQFGGFAMDTKYQVGIYSTPGNMTFTDVSVSAENTPFNYYVSSASEGVRPGKTTNTITVDGSQYTTELFFAANEKGGYANKWEFSGTINRDNVADMILSFGVKDQSGKTQWFSIKEHAAGLDNEGNNTIYNDTNAWWNYPACAFYYRYEDAMTINYKITVENDVLKAYFGKVGEDLQQAWSFPLTDSQFGGFAADSEYQLGMFTRVACGLRFTDVSVKAENAPYKFHVASASQGLSYGKLAGTITNDGTQNTTEMFFAADANGSYATTWEYSGTVNRDNVADVILSFGVKDATGKTQWFSIKEHAAGLDNEGNNTIYNDTNAWWTYPACAFYYRYEDAMTINYKITVDNDTLRAYFGKEGEGLQHAWTFPLTDSQFGGFASGTAYQLGMFTRVACGLRYSNVNVTVSGIANGDVTPEVDTDVLKNKYVSLLGDSITTYEGVSNNGVNNTTISTYHAWYNGAWQNVLNSYEETYWGQVMEKYDMNLLVNNSHNGNRLIEAGGAILAPAGYVRVENLGANTGNLKGTKPDIIVIHMGTNDYIGGVTLGELTADTYTGVVSGSGYKAPATFTEAYIITLEKASKLYPDAQIFVCTLIPSGYNTNWNLLNSYNARIRELAAHYDNVVLVDIAADSGITTSNYNDYTHDGTHPNNAGIAKMAAVLEKAILSAL